MPAWPGLRWRGLASQSWGASWPASLADLEGRTVFFLPKQFFSHSGGLGWAGLGSFFLPEQFFSHSGDPAWTGLTWPGLAWPGLGPI